MSENKIDVQAELVKLYKIIAKRIEKLRESEEKEGKLKPEILREISLALKLLDKIKAETPELKPSQIRVVFGDELKLTDSKEDKGVTETS